MKNQRKTEIKVGLTVLLAIIIFLWIFGWAKNFSLRASENFVKVTFRNVAGLEIGDPVTVNGLRKGYVNKMKALSDQVIVELAVDKDIELKDDAEFSITMLDLMGGKKVEIYPGQATHSLDLNKIHKGKFLSDIPAVMALIGSVQDDLVSVMKDVKITLSSMNKLLTDERLSSDLKNSIQNLNQLTLEVNELIKQNKDDIKKLTSNTISLTEKTQSFIENNEKEFSDVLRNLNSVIMQSEKIMLDVNKLTSETLNQQNNLGKILYDEQVVNDIKNSLKQLNELTSILIEQLKGKGINVDANIF